MTYQEILEGICRHRANRVSMDLNPEMARKLDEIEWALQALAERLAEGEKP